MTESGIEFAHFEPLYHYEWINAWSSASNFKNYVYIVELRDDVGRYWLTLDRSTNIDKEKCLSFTDLEQAKMAYLLTV